MGKWNVSTAKPISLDAIHLFATGEFHHVAVLNVLFGRNRLCFITTDEHFTFWLYDEYLEKQPVEVFCKKSCS